MQFAKISFCALAGALMLACGGAAIPHQELTSAEASVRAAEVGGADKYPRAELHLKRAREQIGQAKQMIEEGENERARFVLNRAAVDAELALALSEEGEAKGEASEALRRIELLMEE